MGRAFYFEILEELQSNDRETIGSARLGYMLKENGIKTIRKSAGKAVILE